MVTTRNRGGSKNLNTELEGDKSGVEKPTTPTTRGTKRKRKSSSTDQGGAGSEIENEPKSSRIEPKEEVEVKQQHEDESPRPIVCECRRDIMTCIGILPSLPIMDRFCDSDDSESDLEDYTHTVLPMVDRSKKQDHD